MKHPFVSVLLLAGGTGTRMQMEIPKQYLLLREQPVILHSLNVFRNMPEVAEIIVVCDPAYQPLFSSYPELRFAPPGSRRQDSVFNGLQCVDPALELICVHDSARPLITAPLVRRALTAAEAHGAATVGMPVKFTVKEAQKDGLVKHTPDRSTVWEIQTPQVIRKELFHKGFAHAQKEGLTVTDDVSLIELIKEPVKLVEGSYTNLKITTREDLLIAEKLIHEV